MKRGAISFFCLLISVGFVAAEDNWSQLRHDAGHTNASKEEARWPFMLLWRARVDKGINGRMNAPGVLPVDLAHNEGTWEQRAGSEIPWPVFADGRVFIGTREGRFLALSAKTGNLLWSAPMPEGARDWAVSENRVLVRTRGNKLLTLDAATGRFLSRLDNLPQSPDGIPSRTGFAPIAGTSGLTLDDDRLYFQGGAKFGQPGEVPFILDGQIYSVDTLLGDVKMGFTPFLSTFNAAVRETLLVAQRDRMDTFVRNNPVNGGTDTSRKETLISGGLEAFGGTALEPRQFSRQDTKQGTVISGGDPTRGGTALTPRGFVLGGSGVSSDYVPPDANASGVLEFSNLLGPTRATHDSALMPVVSGVLVIAEDVFPARLTFPSQQRTIRLAPPEIRSTSFGVVYAADARTSELRWLVLTDWSAPMQVRSTFMNARGLVASGGLVFAPTADGFWHALDVKTGQPRWSAPGSGGRGVLSIAPAVSNGYAYIVGPDYRLRAYDTETGKAAWMTSEYVDGAPLATKNAVVARVGRNSIGVFEKDSGTLVWKQQTSWSPEPVGYMDGIIYDLSPDGILTAWSTAERPFAMGLTWNETRDAHESPSSHFCLSSDNARCEVALINVPWRDNDKDVSSGVLDRVRSANERKVPVALSLSWLSDDRSQLAFPSSLQRGFADAQTRQVFLETVERLAARLKPAYFNLGEDVNIYALYQPQDFPYFVQTYVDAYKRIKEVSPQTKVFVSFQYETLLGLKPATETSFRLLRPVTRPQEDVLRFFADRLDFVGISSEPAAYFAKPEAIPFIY
jgi:outer membrane protein assembly factor BamB